VIIAAAPSESPTSIAEVSNAPLIRVGIADARARIGSPNKSTRATAVP